LSAVARIEVSGAKADVAQLAEHVLGKDEVTSSILVIGSIRTHQRFGWRATNDCSFDDWNNRRQAT
jgi:hypothetical protein